MTSDKQPIYIMPEDVQRTIGKDAQRNNIMAARIISETVKTTLGPKGMDKMLVNRAGEITVTNDGATILKEMDIEHPAAKMIVEIAKTQENEVGDGTTTAVMLVGKFLENAEKLLDQKIHPTIITNGYRLATKKSQELLEELSIEISSEQELVKIAQTAMTGKGAEYLKEKFDSIIVEAIKTISENNKVDLENIKIEKQIGSSPDKTELIKGIVLDKEKVSSEMPQQIQNAKLALLNNALEIKSPETETRISISSPEQLQEFLAQEEQILQKMVEKIKDIGANIVVCQRGIDELAQFYLAKLGIYALSRVPKSDLEKIAKATHGKIISNLREIQETDLGIAQTVEEIKQQEESLTYIRGCQNPKAITIMIRGGTEHIIDEIERAIKDGLGVVSAALEDSKIVSGGGAIEMELAKKLREYAKTIKGRETLAIEEFASALEFIPSTLAENAGLDQIDILTELRLNHESGNIHAGLNLFTEKIENTLESGIIEPLKIKTHALSSASEITIMILRIDDIVASSSGKNQQTPPTNPNMNMDFQGMMG